MPSFRTDADPLPRYHPHLLLGFLLGMGYVVVGYLFRRLPDDLPEPERFTYPLLLVATLPLGAWYWLLVRARSLRIRAPSLRATLLGMTLLALPLFFVQPLGSSDVFANGYYGRLITTHHINPYTVAASTPLEDVWFDLTKAEHPFQLPYGPLWASITAAIMAISGGHVALAVTLFRLLAFGSLLSTVWLLWGRNSEPRYRWAVMAVAWNPFVLFEVVNNAHNDMLMLLSVVVAIVALERGKAAAMLPVLALGAMIKYVPALLMPAAIVALLSGTQRWSKRVLSSLLGTVLAAGIIIASFLPFWSGWATFRQLFSVGMFTAVPFYHPLFLVIWALQSFGAGLTQAVNAGHLFTGSLFVLLTALLTIRVQSTKAFGTASALILLAAAGLLVRYFQPWYLLWPLVLVPLLPSRWHAAALLSLTVLGIATYTFY